MFYRDGVSDGQLEAVSKHELGQLMSAFKTVDPSYDPKWACIIVKKQINQRFLTKTGSEFGNPPPGTVIDSGVTKPEWYQSGGGVLRCRFQRQFAADVLKPLIII